jgi:hypothetical protein
MKRILLAASLLLAPSYLAAQSAVPAVITYQARVTDASGNLIGAGTPVNRTVIFRIYNSPTSTNAADRLHTEQQVVTIANGEFNVLLGTGTAFGTETFVTNLANIFTVDQRYLGVTIDDPAINPDPEISPRQRIVATPYAFRSRIAEGLTSGAVTSAMIANSAVTATQLGSNAVTTVKITDGNVTLAKLAANSVDGSKIVDGSVNTADLANNAVTSGKILDGTIVAADLADGAVTSAKILDGTIVAADLADGAVTSAKILDGTIVAADLADGAVIRSKIGNAAVGATQLGDGAVTAFKLAEGAVQTSKILDGAVSASKLDPAIGGVNLGTYNFFRFHSSPSAGFVFGGYSTQTMEGLNLSYNFFNDTQNDITPYNVAGHGMSRIHVGREIQFFTQALNSTSATKSGDLRMRMMANGVTVIGGGELLGGPTTYNVQIANSRNGIYPFAINIAPGNTDLTKAFSFRNDGVAYKPSGSASTAWAIASDARLKTDVSNLAGVLERLLALRSVNFRYKEGPSSSLHSGFIAQEVQPIFPDWVIDGPDGYLALNPSGFEALTVQAFRELREEKDAEIAALREHAQSLESRLAALERLLSAASTTP